MGIILCGNNIFFTFFILNWSSSYPAPFFLEIQENWYNGKETSYLPPMKCFHNPITNDIVYPNNALIILGAIFFGPIFFFCIGEVLHGFMYILSSLVLWMVLLGWVIWIIYPIVAPRIVRYKWINRGYVETDTIFIKRANEQDKKSE